MADNIRNFSDYKKKVNLERQETEEINIEIQDPLDFLSASEREEYYRTQHEAMDRERESIDVESPEYYFDDTKEQYSEQISQQEPDYAAENIQPEDRPVARKRTRQEIQAESTEAGKQPVARKRTRQEIQAESAKTENRPATRKGTRQEIKAQKAKEKQAVRAASSRMQDEEWYDEDEDRDDGLNLYLIVRIASVLTGIIILVLLGMLFKVKFYDRYFKPDPDEISGPVEVGMIAGYTYTEDTVTTTTELNLRNTPSTASDEFIVTQVPKGTVLDRIAVSDDGTWAQIVYNDEILYCAMKYVTVNE